MTLVLLVEDDVNLLRALETLVTDDGYRVHTAADGQYAMLEVARERPDIIVSDVMMPRMDGLGLVRALLAIPALSGIPVVMTSATALSPAIPVHTFLSKPFSAVRLLEVLRSVQGP
ncbi:CheY-like chemotaxis protein [Paraburkholderia sp. GAS333]|uniref:response regulator n=1 Tax=Paraburkholderia sp. GAS333 TaxID=3156279 RepID=UPI003D20F851